MSESRDERMKRILAKISSGGKQADFPVPDEETILASFDKKNGAMRICVLLHRKGAAHYVILATYVFQGDDMVLQRWVPILDREIEAVKDALMDGFDLAASLEQPSSEYVELPHLLCALPRKGGTKELRITLEAYDKGKNLKLRAWQKEGDTWKRGDEWFFLFVNDLVEILPALSLAVEQIQSAKPSE